MFLQIIWNIFPPQPWTSAVLTNLHFIILWSAWALPKPSSIKEKAAAKTFRPGPGPRKQK